MATGWLWTLLLLLAFSTAVAGGGKGFKGKGNDKGAGKGDGKGEDRPNARERRAMARLAAMLLATPASSSTQGPAPSGLDVLYELYHSQRNNGSTQHPPSSWQHHGGWQEHVSQWQPEEAPWAEDQWEPDDGAQDEQWEWVRVVRPRLHERAPPPAAPAPWLVNPGPPLPSPTMPFPEAPNASSIHRADTSSLGRLGMVSVQTRMLSPGNIPMGSIFGHAVPTANAVVAPIAPPPMAPMAQPPSAPPAMQPPSMFPPVPHAPMYAQPQAPAMVPQHQPEANVPAWSTYANNAFVSGHAETETETETATETESQAYAQQRKDAKKREDKKKADREYQKNSAPRTCFVCHQKGYQWGHCSNPSCPTNGGPNPMDAITSAVQALAAQVAKSTKTVAVKAMPKAPYKAAPKSPARPRRGKAKADSASEADKVIELDDDTAKAADGAPLRPDDHSHRPNGAMDKPNNTNNGGGTFDDDGDEEAEPKDPGPKPGSDDEPSSK